MEIRMVKIVRGGEKGYRIISCSGIPACAPKALYNRDTPIVTYERILPYRALIVVRRPNGMTEKFFGIDSSIEEIYSIEEIEELKNACREFCIALKQFQAETSELEKRWNGLETFVF